MSRLEGENKIELSQKKRVLAGICLVLIVTLLIMIPVTNYFHDINRLEVEGDPEDCEVYYPFRSHDDTIFFNNFSYSDRNYDSFWFCDVDSEAYESTCANGSALLMEKSGQNEAYGDVRTRGNIELGQWNGISDLELTLRVRVSCSEESVAYPNLQIGLTSWGESPIEYWSFNQSWTELADSGWQVLTNTINESVPQYGNLCFYWGFEDTWSDDSQMRIDLDYIEIQGDSYPSDTLEKWQARTTLEPSIQIFNLTRGGDNDRFAISMQSGIYGASPLGIRVNQGTTIELQYAISACLDSDEVETGEPDLLECHSTLLDSVSVNWTAMNVLMDESTFLDVNTNSILVNEIYSDNRITDLTRGTGRGYLLSLSTETLASHELTRDLVDIEMNDLNYHSELYRDIDPRLTTQNQQMTYDFPDSSFSILGWNKGEGSTDFRISNDIGLHVDYNRYIRFTLTFEVVIKHLTIVSSFGLITSINETHESFRFTKQFDYSTLWDIDRYHIVDFDSPTDDNLIDVAIEDYSGTCDPSANGEDWWLYERHSIENISLNLIAQQSYFDNVQFSFSRFHITMWNRNGTFTYLEIFNLNYTITLQVPYLYYRIEAIYHSVV